MIFNINREALLPILQLTNNIVDKRQNLPILSNILFDVSEKGISITATDIEIELIVNVDASTQESGKFTVNSRKLLDFCKTLNQNSVLLFDVNDNKVLIKSEKSRFTLASLPYSDYPNTKTGQINVIFSIEQKKIENIIENTQFAIAHQDVRYYLNGLLLEISKNKLRAVATDGHRLALDEVEISTSQEDTVNIIIPRKGISELRRVLTEEGELNVKISSNHIQVEKANLVFTCKLIDGKFPEYNKVIPEKTKTLITVSREKLYNSLIRASILSKEKYRGVKFILSEDVLKILAYNPEQEKIEEELKVNYKGEEMEIGFNVSYLLDALSTIKSEELILSILNPNSSCLITPNDNSNCQYVVMPMRL